MVPKKNYAKASMSGASNLSTTHKQKGRPGVPAITKYEKVAITKKRKELGEKIKKSKMPVYVLTETPAGYGLFESTDRRLLKRNDLATELQKSEKILDILKLKSFTKFESAAVALEEAAALAKGQVPPLLASLLSDMNKEAKATVAVSDLKLATSIGHLPQINIKAVAGSNLGYLYRSIREHLCSLMPQITAEDFGQMSLGLGHSISRHRIKFSADKIDSMVCHTVKILDDVDRETNVFAMRLKEWYNWHWPELFKIIDDNIVYARMILTFGRRTSCIDADLSDVLPEELEPQVKESASRSMGTDLGDGDLENCQLLAKQVMQFSDMRRELSAYLESRMQAIAPNLTALVGFLVGARLISHVGTVTGLSKSPASTIQILGAEKALFRALKTKHDTPKYGLIYHCSLIGQASNKNKGKMSRLLAAKAALGVRLDAFSDNKDDGEDYETRASFGLNLRLKLESRLRVLEGRSKLPDGVGIGPDGQVLGPGQLIIRETRRYNADADGVAGGSGHARTAPPGSNGTAKKSPKIQIVETREITMQDGDSEESSIRLIEDAPPSAPSSEEDGSSAKKADQPKPASSKKKERKRAEAEADSAGPTTGPKKLTGQEYERLAAEAGLSVKKFKRKYERGDIEIPADGTVKVISKKELKKARKAQAEEDPAAGGQAQAQDSAEKQETEPAPETGKKRKHREVVEDDDEDEAERREQKKSKKEKKEKMGKKDKKEKKAKKTDRSGAA